MKWQKRNLQRALSLALSVMLVVGDGSLLKVSAADGRSPALIYFQSRQTQTGKRDRFQLYA